MTDEIIQEPWALVLNRIAEPFRSKTLFQVVAQDGSALPCVSSSKIRIPSLKDVCSQLPLPTSIVDVILQYLPLPCEPHVSLAVSTIFHCERTGLMLFIIAALELVYPSMSTRFCVGTGELTLDLCSSQEGFNIADTVDQCLRLYTDLPLSLGPSGISADLSNQRSLLFQTQIPKEVAAAVPLCGIGLDGVWPVRRVTVLTRGLMLPTRVYSGLLYLCLPLECGQTVCIQAEDDPVVVRQVYGAGYRAGPVVWINNFETYNPIDYTFNDDMYFVG